MAFIKKHLDKLELNPPRFLVVGFGVLIVLGAILLSLPIASKNGESIGFINALFTSASAVCVTGLTVVNTAEHWSLFGHIVILILIQMGGLGFMTSATIMALLVGRKISLRERLIIREQLNQDSLSGLVRLTRYVIISTFIIEGIGALLLSTRFIPIFGLIKGIWFSIFHAISAFCNAGFDIIGNSMMSFVGDFTVNLTICFLIIVGGLGFSVLIDISNKKNFNRLSLHSKLVLSITIALIAIGMLIIFIVERNNPDSLGGLSKGEKLLASFFSSGNSSHCWI